MSKQDPEAKRRSRIIMAAWSTGAVVIVILFIILAKLVSGGGSTTGGPAVATTAPASLISKLTSIPDSVFNAVGQGSVTILPKKISAPALTDKGKPSIVYIGAEYCPYCAAERWPVIIALSRFGSFAGLQRTSSSSQDTYPGTATFSFHGATYTSQYISFTGRETESNQVQGTHYAPLDTLTADQQSLLSTYDAAPYVAASSAGAIPFIDFGGQYLISGSTYSPQVLQGKTADQIADSLTQTNSDISKGAIGAANTITAAICKLTDNQPGNVCSSSMIQALEAKLGS